jgi:hypothetical protein
MKMHLLSFPNGFKKTECVGKKLKNIAPNGTRLKCRFNALLADVIFRFLKLYTNEIK